MWIVKIALGRPYTFLVMAAVLLILGPLTIARTPTDIFPSINLPVISVIWNYAGLPAPEMANRITANFDRVTPAVVNNVEHIDSTSLNGVAVSKIYLHPGADVARSMAQVTAGAQYFLRNLPQGTTPPLVLNYNASSVPVVQLALSGKGLSEQALYDTGNIYVRSQLSSVRGASLPYPYGGKQRQIQVDLDPLALAAHGISAEDVQNAIAAQNLIIPAGTQKIGGFEYKANAGLASSTARRVAGLVPSQSVSVQDSEDRSAAATGATAQVAAAQANLARLRQLKGFERVIAPFDGTITARSIDVGSLISAGGTQGTPLFRIADTRSLRTYVDVPQTYASAIRTGMTADLAFPDRPGKPVAARVTRTAAAIDPASRTLKTEIDIDNRQEGLFPGAFVEVHFHPPPLGHALRVPANTLLMRPEGPRLAIADAHGSVHLRAITLGRDFGTSVEVLTGVNARDRVIVNPAAATEEGDHVRAHAAPAPRKGA